MKNAFDIGFMEGFEPPQGMVARALGPIPCRMVASPAYLEKSGTPMTLEDLQKARILTLSSYPSSWALECGGRAFDLPVKPAFTANSAGTLLGICLAGGGIACQPADTVEDYVRQGRLRVVLPEVTGVPHIMYAVVPSRRNLSPLVRACLAHVEASLDARRPGRNLV